MILDIPTKFLYASFSLRLPAHAYPEGSETRYEDMMVYEQVQVKKNDGSQPKQKLLDRARDIMRARLTPQNTPSLILYLMPCVIAKNPIRLSDGRMLPLGEASGWLPHTSAPVRPV